MGGFEDDDVPCNNELDLRIDKSNVQSVIAIGVIITSEMDSIVGASVSESLSMFMVYVCKVRLLVELEINVAYNATL